MGPSPEYPILWLTTRALGSEKCDDFSFPVTSVVDIPQKYMTNFQWIYEYCQ
jgi:hypothetical protein